MKVVLFCGGMGTRLREYSNTLPKPLVPIGERPILWHLMRYYAAFGHKEFILCLGYRGDLIKRYFLDYDECMSNDFVFENGGRSRKTLSSDIEDWRITFVDTGLHANIGERLLQVAPHLAGEEAFLANYADGLSDVPLDRFVGVALSHGVVASMLAVRPAQSFHGLRFSDDGMVSGVTPLRESQLWLNGGFFVLRRRIFDYLRAGEDLVAEPFERLAAERQLWAWRYDGFWSAMDTFKDKIEFDRRYARGDAPWQVWRSAPGPTPHALAPMPERLELAASEHPLASPASLMQGREGHEGREPARSR
jgi:glucose-1-phosphate cytidylyltransferase